MAIDYETPHKPAPAPRVGPGMGNITGSANEPIPCGAEHMHPRSYKSEMLVEAASQDTRTMKQAPKITDQFKG